MSTTLPALIPFNDPVTVCAECLCAACAQGRHRCAAAKAGRASTKSEALFMLRALAKENPSYWKVQRPERDDDLPLDVEDMEHLVRWTRKQGRTERALLASYLEHELGIDTGQVAAAMAKEWPEAAEASPC